MENFFDPQNAILISSAWTFLKPFLQKSGEKIAESIGEDMWKVLKKPFANREDNALINDFQKESEEERIKAVLIEKISNDESYKIEIENALSKAQKDKNAYQQQNINNNSQVEKQINIQNNTGNINF